VVFVGLALLAAVVSVLMIARSGVAQGKGGALWPAQWTCTDETHDHATGIGAIDYLSGDGAYMARTHCMVTAEGDTDWTWVWLLVALNVLVIAGYMKIFIFWRRAYLQEELQDRNKKLMDLAWIFMFCACCGYISSIMLFFWPGYRLLALALCPLAFFTWKFAANLEDFKLSLSAKRLSRQLHESLKEQNERLSRDVEIATQELREATEAAERANRAKSEFLARMSHEIRTPLTAIMGYIRIAMDESESNPECHEHLQRVDRNSKHLLTLINDILDVSKIEAGEMAYEFVPCSMRDIADGVIDLLRPRAQEAGTTLRVDVDEAIPGVVNTDPTRVRQMMMNLVGNAIKFTRDGEVHIEISPIREGRSKMGGIEVVVADTGVGMTQEQSEMVFEKFNQGGQHVTREFGGTGLGLTISRQIARALGGDLTVTSEPGKGSRFCCTFKCGMEAEASHDDQRASGQSREGVESLTACLDDKRILLVEDTEDNVKLIQHHFQRHGLSFEHARNGEEGLERVLEAERESGGYDLVLMDISMPIKDGVEALRELRGAGCEMPVVMLSAHALLDEQRRCYDAGASAYCTKPIDFAELFDCCASFFTDDDGRQAA